MLSRDAILDLRLVSGQLDTQVRRLVNNLGCSRRGCRAGRHVRMRTHRTVVESETSWKIPVVRTNSCFLSEDTSTLVLYRGRRQPRPSALRPINRRLASPVKVGVFNARSVSTAGKSQSISTWITDHNFTAAGLVETWHDGPDSPALVACAPPGYAYVERSRQRTDRQEQSTSSNHGGVCLLYRDYLHMRVVSTSHYQSFEHIAVFLHGSGLKCLFVVIYRPGSTPASSAFFEELADLVESVISYSSVIIIGDINIHLDLPNDPGTVSFSSLLSTSHLVQVVQSPSHV